MHKEIAPRLEKKIRESGLLKTNPKIRKKLKELFRMPESSFISGFYRHALAELAEARFREEGFTFDQELARRNYRYILLNLLAEENDAKSLSLIVSHLLKESESFTQEKDWEYLKNLWEVLEKKINEDAALVQVFEGLERHIGSFIESAYFQGEVPAGLEYFLDRLKKSYLGFNYYLEKIFNEGKVNPDVLKLFLRFFPGNLSLFYARLEERSADIDFQATIVKSLEGIDPLKALEVLKKIFSFAHNLIKIDVLKAMQKLSCCDEAFLFPILEKGDTLLKKEALAVVAKDERLKKIALQRLLSFPSPWGMKNRLLMEHINIVAELDLREAKDYLALLSKRPFFWNKNLRQKANAALKEWHAGQD